MTNLSEMFKVLSFILIWRKLHISNVQRCYIKKYFKFLLNNNININVKQVKQPPVKPVDLYNMTHKFIIWTHLKIS